MALKQAQDLKLGDKVWKTKADYRRSESMMDRYSEYTVFGETKLSWLVGYMFDGSKCYEVAKIPKNGKFKDKWARRKFVLSIEEMEQREWVKDNHNLLVSKLSQEHDYDTLRKIADLLVQAPD